MSVEDLQTALGDYEDILTFEEVGEFITVKMEYQHGPTGRAKWEAINEQIKQFGGEWISNGKLSHWKVPKVKGTPQPPMAPKEARELGKNLAEATIKLQLIRDGINLIEKGLTKLREASH